MDAERLTIGRLAAAAGVNVETVRYYQRRGLLVEPAKPPRGTRTYAPEDVARLRFIRRAQPLGFSLDEIAELLDLRGQTGCRQTQELTESKLADVRGRIAELQEMESELERLVARCGDAAQAEGCPALEFFGGP